MKMLFSNLTEIPISRASQNPIAIALILPFIILTGCSPMRFSKYTGQNTVWPTSSGAMADTSYAIPVYHGPPERAYDVIGSIRFEDPRKYWDDGIIRMAADTGRAHGGDALIFVTGSVTPSSWLDNFTTRPTGYGEEQTAQVIKWTPEHILQARKAEEDNFWNAFRQKVPRLASNTPLVQLAIGYLNEAGVTRNSPEMESKLTSLLTELEQQPKQDLTGKWLFKGLIQTKTITSASDSKPFFGTATATMSGTRLTLISADSRVEISFSGAVEAGQLNGTLGIGTSASSLSIKCEGVAVNNKIAFAFQKLTEGGTVQGNLTFQR